MGATSFGSHSALLIISHNATVLYSAKEIFTEYFVQMDLKKVFASEKDIFIILLQYMFKGNGNTWKEDILDLVENHISE